jgi:carbonic anhydrase
MRGIAAALLPLALSMPLQAASSLCDSGRRQSPIDIGATQTRTLAPLEFQYRPAPLTLANDGHTLRLRLATAGNELRIGTERYALRQLHFHTPGGDRIAGEEFPMAAHLLHKSAAGQLVSVVVLFRLGAENPVLAQLLPHAPERVDGDHLVAGESVDASKLLPSGRGYYRYAGSLTSAPCTEGVDWIVLKQPVELSAAQLARYRERFADNARPVQPLHGRSVLESR